jgi:peptide deformylase
MGAGKDYVAFFNPVLLAASTEESHMMEGCLSFPYLGLRITRPSGVVVQYQDFNGEVHRANFTGISARCFLHELDHLNGIVYTDRCKPLALKQGMKKRNKINGLIQKSEKNLKKMEKYGNAN